MRDERTQPLSQSDLLRGSEERPSGLKFGPGSFAGTKTPFPSALITAGNSSGAEGWRKRLKAEGLPAHPCPMPIPVPKFAIELLTRPAYPVLHPFFWSGPPAPPPEELS